MSNNQVDEALAQLTEAQRAYTQNKIDLANAWLVVNTLKDQKAVVEHRLEDARRNLESAMRNASE